MKDDSTKDNLDTAIKEVLINHEAAFNQQDWNEIEKLLDAQPKERSFKWNFVFIVFVGIAALAATYFISHFASSDKTIKNEEATITPVGGKVVSTTTADSSTVSAKKDTATSQVPTTVNNSNKNSIPQETVTPIVIDETDKQKERTEKSIQKNTEISEIRNRKSKNKGDSLKTRNLLQKKRLAVANADSANKHSIDITEEKGIISTNEIEDNVESISISDAIEKINIDNKKAEEKILASDSTSQKSTPTLKRKLKFKKRK